MAFGLGDIEEAEELFGKGRVESRFVILSRSLFFYDSSCSYIFFRNLFYFVLICSNAYLLVRSI